MNHNKPKLLLVIVIIILTIAVAVSLNRTKCMPRAIKVAEQIKGFEDSLAIREILIFQSLPGGDIHLNDDTLKITDVDVLKEIQRMIFQSKRRRINHPVPTWVASLNIVFLNNDQLTMDVSKLNNDSIPAMTHFSFPGNECPGDEIYYSLELGIYLEQIVSTQRKNY